MCQELSDLEIPKKDVFRKDSWDQKPGRPELIWEDGMVHDVREMCAELKAGSTQPRLLPEVDLIIDY